MKAFRDISIVWKLSIVIAALVLSMVVGIGLSLNSMYHAMLAERLAKVRALTETLVSMAIGLQKRAAAGELTTETAKAIWVNNVSNMFYDGTEYMFAQTEQGVLVAHPRPDMVGRNLLNMKDPTGKPFVQELIKAANSSPAGGPVEYSWARSADTPAEPKVSWSMLVPEWNFVVGTGVFYDDMRNAFIEKALAIGGAMAAIVLLAVTFAAVMARDIGTSLRTLAGTMKAMAGGDLAVAVSG